MPLPLFLIVLAGIALAAFSVYLDHKKKTGGTVDAKALEETIAALHAALAEGEAERERLAERVRNLEAIVATETYDLLRNDLQEDDPERAAARLDAALADVPPLAGALDPDALDDDAAREAEDARRADDLARLARRLRAR